MKSPQIKNTSNKAKILELEKDLSTVKEKTKIEKKVFEKTVQKVVVKVVEKAVEEAFENKAVETKTVEKTKVVRNVAEKLGCSECGNVVTNSVKVLTWKFI